MDIFLKLNDYVLSIELNTYVRTFRTLTGANLGGELGDGLAGFSSIKSM